MFLDALKMNVLELLPENLICVSKYLASETGIQINGNYEQKNHREVFILFYRGPQLSRKRSRIKKQSGCLCPATLGTVWNAVYVVRVQLSVIRLSVKAHPHV